MRQIRINTILDAIVISSLIRTNPSLQNRPLGKAGAFGQGFGANLNRGKSEHHTHEIFKLKNIVYWLLYFLAS